jgi:hypothetical protein
MSASLASTRKTAWRMWRVWRVSRISENGRFGECEYSPKTANFWRVLEFAKFAGE